MAHDVFISFSFKDQEIAEKIVNQLLIKYGISCWLSIKDIQSASNYRSQVLNAILDAKVVVFIQSSNAVESREIPKEIGVALDRDKIIIPFKIDDAQLTGDLLYDLFDVEYIDATMPTLEERIHDLAKAISKAVGKPLLNQLDVGDDDKVPKHDVYLCFNLKDQPVAEDAVDQLGKYGISSWISTRDIKPGNKFKSAIYDAIQSAKAIVFLQSKNSIGSNEVSKEIRIAIEKNKPIIPIKLDEAELSDCLKYDLYGIDQIDASTQNSEQYVLDLAQSISRITGKSLSHPDNHSLNTQKLSVFLSHSHKDIEKVRKLRDILEYLECEPLLFYLKCLDDNDEELQSFIKREIEARNIFLYCKSQNAESSSWVQKELDYIKSFDSNRLYTIDIDKNLTRGMIGLLQTIIDIVQGNQVFLSYSHKDQPLFEKIKEYLSSQGYNVFNALGEFKDVSSLRNKLDEISNNGIFIPLVTANYMQSRWCNRELEYAIYSKATVVPVVMNDVELSKKVKSFIENISWIQVSEDLTDDDLRNVLQTIKYANFIRT